uniref:(northern house mosquito) hypothetical protein n=1 Tax=Culex pipiens TaxID=7175 RepID=A0A8D8KLD5_CULPI
MPSLRFRSSARSRSRSLSSSRIPSVWPMRSLANALLCLASSATWSTTSTACVNRLRRRLRARETSSASSARPTPKPSCGVPSTSRRVLPALRSSRKPRGSCRPALPRLRRPLSRSTRSALLWRRPSSACPPKSRICSSRSTVPPRSPTLPRRSRRPSTRSSESGSSRSTIWLPSWTLPRRNAATTRPSCSVSRVPTKRARSSLRLSAVRTRTWLMRSRICWTRSVRVAATSTRLRSLASAWRLRRTSCRPPLRKPRLLWNRRRTRFCALSLSCLRCARKLTAASRRRKRNSRTPARTTSVPWTPCRPLLKPKPRVRLRPCA